MSIPIDRYAVMGNPIAHSKSPRIHQLFAHQTQQRLSYEAILVDPELFSQAVANFYRQGGKGLNITVPLKQLAWELATQRSTRAQRAGAVNTLILHPDGKHFGENTDGVGLMRDLRHNKQVTIRQKQVFVLGAGGAVRGILEPLLLEQAYRVVIVNRTLPKAQELANLFSDLGNIEAISYEDLTACTADIIINGTSASLSGQLPPLPPHILTAETVCYDMMYSKEPTAFLRWARQQGAHHIMDGLGMLVEQAAESFYLWRGVRPQTTAVIEQLRKEM